MVKLLLAVISYAWVTDPGPQAPYAEKMPKQNTIEDKKEVLNTLNNFPEFKKLSARL